MVLHAHLNHGLRCCALDAGKQSLGGRGPKEQSARGKRESGFEGRWQYLLFVCLQGLGMSQHTDRSYAELVTARCTWRVCSAWGANAMSSLVAWLPKPALGVVCAQLNAHFASHAERANNFPQLHKRPLGV